MRDDCAGAGDHVDIALDSTTAATTTAAHATATLLHFVNVLFQVVGAAGGNSLFDLLVKFAHVAGFPEHVFVLRDEFFDLGGFVEEWGRLFHALIPEFAAHFLDLAGFILHQILDFGDAVGAEAGLEDVFDLVDGVFDLLFRFGAVLVTHLLQLVEVAADFVFEGRVVVHNLLASVAGQFADAGHVFL